jgi:hypothetical protein
MDTATSGIFWGIVGSVIGSLATVWYISIRRFLEARKGEFTGEWKQIIPPYDGEPEKIAVVKCKHIGDKLYGQTERISPKAQFVQRWQVEARIKRGLIFGIYWPEDSAKLPGSYGTLQFKILDENLFDGFYVRVRSTQKDEQGAFKETLNTIPIKWERMFSDQT